MSRVRPRRAVSKSAIPRSTRAETSPRARTRLRGTRSASRVSRGHARVVPPLLRRREDRLRVLAEEPGEKERDALLFELRRQHVELRRAGHRATTRIRPTAPDARTRSAEDTGAAATRGDRRSARASSRSTAGPSPAGAAPTSRRPSRACVVSKTIASSSARPTTRSARSRRATRARLLRGREPSRAMPLGGERRSRRRARRAFERRRRSCLEL